MPYEQKKNSMNDFFEFFIRTLLWVWMPLYSLYRVIRDIVEDIESREPSK